MSTPRRPAPRSRPAPISATGRSVSGRSSERLAAAAEGRLAAMDVSSLAGAEAFTTKDGSTIRELHHTALQSLAEASIPAGEQTQRHYHAVTEEIYFFSRALARWKSTARAGGSPPATPC